MKLKVSAVETKSFKAEKKLKLNSIQIISSSSPNKQEEGCSNNL